MARISIDPTEIKKHPKFHAFRKKLDWPSHHAFGFLCAFWGEVANTEANESGDISDWTPDYLADRISLNIDDPNRLWEALVPGYIEVRQNERFFVRDWIEIFGPALRQKYHNTDRQKLIDTWGAYGRIYGRESKTPSLEQDGKSQGHDPTSFSIEKEMDAIDAKKRGISAPEFGSLSSSLSTPLPSSHPEEDLKAFTPPGNRARAHEEKTSPAVGILQKLFYEKLAEKLKETPADFNWGLAGKVFKKLLDENLGIQEIAWRFDAWFKSTLPFIENQSYDVKLFPKFFNKLKDGPIANQVGSNAREPFNDGAATVREEAGAY